MAPDMTSSASILLENNLQTDHNNRTAETLHTLRQNECTVVCPTTETEEWIEGIIRTLNQHQKSDIYDEYETDYESENYFGCNIVAEPSDDKEHCL